MKNRGTAKHLPTVLKAAIVLLVVFAIASCDALLGLLENPEQEILDRLDAFESDLNTEDRSDSGAALYRNFHPTLTADYAALRDPSVINSFFPYDDRGTGYEVTASTDDYTVEQPRLTGTVSFGPDSGRSTADAVFVMARYDGSDPDDAQAGWRIRSFEFTLSSTSETIDNRLEPVRRVVD
jgi:hypothetical protein